MIKLAVLLVVLGVLVGQGSAQGGPQLTIPGLGVVEGDIKNSYVTERPFFRFRGIPFAEPPIGSYRFQPPGPLQPWGGVYNATEIGQRCPQTGTGAKSFLNLEYESEMRASDDVEDCLYLSVYTPQTGVGVNMPVIVFYHGGSFLTGSGLMYDGEKFMDENVVLVVPHYRLGPIGFLSLETDEIPGNAGMLDQVAALQWVRDHIDVFGGNPDAITVMGESAGGASSSFLNISPLSTGLFQQYICQSGSSLALWALDRDPLSAAVAMGPLINCTGSDIPTLTACYQTVDAMDLIRAFEAFQVTDMAAGNLGISGSAPVIQKAGAVKFLERDPRDILREGSYVPKRSLMGSNKHEGTLVYSIIYNDYIVPNNLQNDATYFERDFTKFMLDFFGVEDQGETIASGVEKAYMGLNNMGNMTAMAGGIIDFTGAMFLKGPVFEEAQYNAQHAPTFLYAFRFLGDVTLWPFIGDVSLTPGGVCHANEILLQFNVPVLILRARDRAMSQKIIKLWTNFATYGEPNPAANPVGEIPAWPVFESIDGFYMRLDENSTLMQDYTVNEYFASGDEGFPWF